MIAGACVRWRVVATFVKLLKAFKATRPLKVSGHYEIMRYGYTLRKFSGNGLQLGEGH